MTSPENNEFITLDELANLDIEPSLDIAEQAPELAEAPGTDNEGPSILKKVGNWFSRNRRKVLFAGGIAVAGVGVAYAGSHDIDYNSMAKSIDISSIGRDFIDIAEVGGPMLLAAGGLQIATMAYTRPGRKNLQLAWRGLSNEKRSARKRIVAGAMLPALGIGAITNALMIEDGIHRGANPNILSMDSNITGAYPGTSAVWNMQSGTHHFMNDSSISHETFGHVTKAIGSNKYPAVKGAQPFYRDLVTIPTPFSGNQAGMVISVDHQEKPSVILPEIKDGAECEIIDNRCNLAPGEIIIDENEGFKIGDNVNIRGHNFKVVAFPKEDQSLVNRLIAFSGVDNEEMNTKDYFGFVTVTESVEQAKLMIRDLNLDNELDQETTKEFLDANDDFWYHNGTTLLFLLIADISLFSGATFAAVKNFEQEKNLPVIATMKALGASSHQLASQQYARSVIMTTKGIIPGGVGAAAATELINKILVGFHGQTDLRMVGAASGLVLATQIGATAKMMHSMKGEAEAQLMKSR